jgi:hypothetical protein
MKRVFWSLKKTSNLIFFLTKILKIQEWPILWLTPLLMLQNFDISCIKVGMVITSTQYELDSSNWYHFVRTPKEKPLKKSLRQNSDFFHFIE